MTLLSDVERRSRVAAGRMRGQWVAHFLAHTTLDRRGATLDRRECPREKAFGHAAQQSNAFPSVRRDRFGLAVYLLGLDPGEELI